MNSNNRGFVILPYLIGLLIVAAGYQAYKVFQPGRNKAKADQAAIAAQDTSKQATAVDTTASSVKTAVAEVEAAHAKKDALNEEIKTNAAIDTYGVKVALTTEKNPSPNVQLALTINDGAYAALGISLTPQQRAVYDKLLQAYTADRISLAQAQAQVADITAKHAATQATLAATTARVVAADTHATQLTTQLKDQTTQLVKVAAKSSTLTAENRAWADKEETWWQRVVALGWLSVILAVVAALVLVKLVGVQNALGDMVALGEHLKSGLVTAGKDVVEIEKDVASWWEGSKNQKVVEDIKKNVLRQ